MKQLTTITTIFLLVFQLNLFAQEEARSKFENTITAEDLKGHLSVIASDEFEGRETGEKGQKIAAEYISNYFKEIGLEGPVKDAENPFFQTFTLYKSTWGEIKLSNSEKEFALYEDYFPYGSFQFDNETLELVFAGYGLDGEEYSDYKDLDVNGKIVLVLDGEPKADGEEGEKKSNGFNPFSKIETAKEKGARAVFFIMEDENQFDGRSKMMQKYGGRPSLSFDNPTEGTGIFFTTSTKAAELLGVSTKKFEKTVNKISLKKGSSAGSLNNEITVTVKRTNEEVRTENVLGYLEGGSKKEEVIVITSHYDHIGVSGDEINNGADDDGSGTVTVLELAEAFSKAKKNGNGPERSILFMTVTGEEKGLLGSRYYSENPIFKLENTVCNLNIDMVGRVDKEHEDKPNYVYIIGSDMLSSELHNLSAEVAKKYAPDFLMDYKYNSKDDPNRFYYRSDHYNFAKHGIPVIFYFNGTHDDYHRPTDTIEKINFEVMENRARLIYNTAWEIANREKRLVVDKEPNE
ncbi:M28 family peptidase [Flexithrix dorotheae]|uniref:M28 family peptidase n=1 Tax=Flexithrix dorotheae TaxID=70993 RepID=UPI00036115BE|nr:M28 family peptidase [Flexithrix dorotheae]